MANVNIGTRQCQKPKGWLGRLVLRMMNARHSKVTDWGLSHVSFAKDQIVLDVGCGGGRTVSKLAELASEGKVFGIDYSAESVSFGRKTNQEWIRMGRVEIQQAAVSQLPFPDSTFNTVTAVETHFWWPDLPAGMREILRVLKPGGTLVIVAEIFRNSRSKTAEMLEKYASLSGMKYLTSDEHRQLFAGYSDIQVTTAPEKGWICCIGRKPLCNSTQS